MCGLFGFIGKNPNNDILNRLGQLASRRGPDGWGYFDGKDYKMQLGAYKDQDFSGCNVVFGHCRLHTIIGTSNDLGYLQPNPSSSAIVCFNGAIQDLPENYDSDTRYLHDLIKYNGLRAAIDLSHLAKYSLVCWDRKRKKISVAVKEISLYIGRINGDTYWCSKKFISAKKFEGFKVLWQGK